MSVPALLAALAVQAAPAMVLPGDLGLPLLAGTTRSAECMGLRERFDGLGKPFECLATTVALGNERAFQYIDAAKAKGWQHAGGAANALMMIRPLDDGGCQRLSIAAFPGTEAMAPGDPAYLLFAVDPAGTCPPPRPASGGPASSQSPTPPGSAE